MKDFIAGLGIIIIAIIAIVVGTSIFLLLFRFILIPIWDFMLIL